MKRYERIYIVLSVVIPLILIVAWTFPIVLNLKTSVPGPEEDNVAYLWIIQNMEKAVTQGKSIFRDDEAYYPVGYNSARNELTPATTLMALPFSLLWGPVAAYNIVLFATFALMSLCMYLWLRSFTTPPIALMVGVVSAFLPYRTAHMLHHMELMPTHWFALGLFAIERYSRTGNVRWAIGLGVSYALASLTSWHYLIFGALLFPIYIFFRVPWKRENSLKHGLIAIAVAATLITPFAIPVLAAQQSRPMTRPLSVMTLYSLLPQQIFGPAWNADPIKGRYSPWEFEVSVGIIIFLLSIAGAALSPKRKLVKACIVIALVGVVLSMGPYLIMATTDATIVTLAGHQITLPYWFFSKLPVVSAIRTVSRYALIANFALLGLAALGVTSLLRRYAPRQFVPLIILLTGALTLTELWRSKMETLSMVPREVDIWLAQQPKGTVLEWPPAVSGTRAAVKHRLTHGQPSAMGLKGSFPPPDHVARQMILARLPSPKSVTELCNWETRYILHDTSYADPHAKRWEDLLGKIPHIRFDRQVGPVKVYLMENCG